MKLIDAYKEMLKTVEGFASSFDLDSEIDIRSKLKLLIRREEVSAAFNIKIKGMHYGDYYRLSEYQSISIYGEQYNRTISWPADGRQPNDEWLHVISFPTGAYIFGEAYPTNTFKDFFSELKSFEPAYTDTANHCLYFSPDNAYIVHGKFWNIFNKYKSMVSEELKANRIKAIKEELEKLQGGAS